VLLCHDVLAVDDLLQYSWEYVLLVHFQIRETGKDGADEDAELDALNPSHVSRDRVNELGAENGPIACSSL